MGLLFVFTMPVFRRNGRRKYLDRSRWLPKQDKSVYNTEEIPKVDQPDLFERYRWFQAPVVGIVKLAQRHGPVDAHHVYPHWHDGNRSAVGQRRETA